MLRWSPFVPRTVLVVCALAGGLAAWAWHETHRALAASGAAIEVRVPAGASARGIARQLAEAGLDLPAWEFVLAAEWTRAERSLRPGRYRFGGSIDLLGVVDKFRRGEVEREPFVIIEGTTFAELRASLANCDFLRHETAAWTEGQILAALGASRAHAEGLFAPDTYLPDPGTSDLDLLRHAYAAQMDRLERAWATRSPDLPYAEAYEALIMASIIEKETGRPEDRRQVGAVFVNRQRLHMPLQTDPTVIYGLGPRYDGHLHKRDLLADGPFNTYTRVGLPPSPISLPGRAALEAALQPATDKVLYFVARGDGSSEFSTTLADHNRAVDRYQRAAATPRADGAVRHASP